MLNIIEEMLIVLVWRLRKGGVGNGGGKGSGVSIAGQIILEDDRGAISTYIHAHQGWEKKKKRFIYKS